MAGNKPTGKQLRYLRALAERTGTTFSPPATMAAASRAIGELERDAVSHGLPRGLDSAAVRPAEVSGYGGNCRWRGHEQTR